MGSTKGHSADQWFICEFQPEVCHRTAASPPLVCHYYFGFRISNEPQFIFKSIINEPVSNPCSQSSARFALSVRTERALLNWIPFKSRLYAVRLNDPVPANSSRLNRPCLLMVSVYMPTECRFPETKNELRWELSELLWSLSSTDVVMVAGDFNAHLGCLEETGRHIGS